MNNGQPVYTSAEYVDVENTEGDTILANQDIFDLVTNKNVDNEDYIENDDINNEKIDSPDVAGIAGNEAFCPKSNHQLG